MTSVAADRERARVEPDVDMALGFLTFLFAPALEGYVNLFSVEHETKLRRTAWAPVEDIRSLAPAIESFARRGDVWFGCALRKGILPSGARGGLPDCLSIPGLWLDVDVDSPEHRREGYAKSYEHAREVILSFGEPPDAIVRSGYGFQAWWRFRETLDAKEALPVLARWGATWDEAKARAGVEVDDVFDLPRVMRLPGTHNFKSEHGPVKATVRVRANPTEREWEPFIEARLAPLPEPSSNGKGSRTATAHLAGSRFNEVADHGLILEQWGRCNLIGSDALTETWHYINAGNDGSATFYRTDRHITVWSETMAAELGLEVKRPYDLFGFWASIKHKGDLAMAHADLVEHGIPDRGSSAVSVNGKDKPRHREPEVVSTQAVTRRMSKVERERIEWLWVGRIPFGKVLILEGDPDRGKSTLALDIAARITSGKLMPDDSEPHKRGNVIIMSAEDGPGDTIRPRLEAAGADLDKVIILDGIEVTKSDGTTEKLPAVLPDHFDVLERTIIEDGAVEVIIDMLPAYLSDRVDSHKDQAIRREILAPLSAIADRTKVAIVCLRHLTKSSSSKMLYRGQGSIAIIGQARAGLMVVDDPDDPSKRILLPHKMNIAAKAPAWSFQVRGNSDLDCSYIHWLGPSQHTEATLAIESLSQADNQSKEDDSSVVEDAGQWLDQVLSPDGMEVQNLREEMEKAGFKWRTLERAKARKRIKTERVGNPRKGEIQTYKWVLTTPPNENDSAK